nr:hypothetical protein HmN_001000700 [Hymenolepis microstoma]
MIGHPPSVQGTRQQRPGGETTPTHLTTDPGDIGGGPAPQLVSCGLLLLLSLLTPIETTTTTTTRRRRSRRFNNIRR